MKIPHRVPDVSPNMTGRLDPAYEGEVERSTERGEREYAQAQRRVDAAERRARRAEAEVEAARSPKERRLTRKQLAVAWALVELRRQDLAVIERTMQSSPASAGHRGDRSYRPVPDRHGPGF